MKHPIKNLKSCDETWTGWTQTKASSVFPAVGIVGWVVKYDLQQNRSLLYNSVCLFANMQWPCAARLHLISSVSTTTFIIIPQMSTQESIQIKAGPVRSCFDAIVTTLTYKKIWNCMAHFSSQLYSETYFWHHVNVWRKRINFYKACFIFLQLVLLWPRQTTMSNVKTVGWLCQAKYAMPVYYFIVQENMLQQGPECP